MDTDTPDNPRPPPPARDLDGEAMRRRIHARLFGGEVEAVRIGRFQILETLGQGGMGVVYAAEDAQLDRQVALKVIRDAALSGGAGERARLLREARALAKLSHPNVVQVHEVGEHEGDVFIVMELVRGTTLGQWLAAEPRSLPAILERFIAAAQGLEAAHRVGIVHRDFKPTNALVGADGRVRIVDFGLARGEPKGLDITAVGRTHTTPDQPEAVTLTTLTQAGTPAYMSPEQAIGAMCDARSDQFSFCVALFEAVYGRRPYTPEQLLAHANHSDAWPSPVPKDGPAPKWLRKVLARGLAPLPAQRFASMAAVIDVLQRAPRQRRRLALAGLAVAVLGATATAGGLLVGAPAIERCPDPRARLAEVWGPPQRSGLRSAFAATPLGEAASVRTEQALDAYTGRWVDAQRDACEATLVRHEQSATRLDQSSKCLDRARRAFANLTATLPTGDLALLSEAEALVADLPDPLRCRDPAVLDGPAPALDLELETLLDRAQIFETTQQGREAAATLGLAITRAEALGDAGGEAQALLLLGKTRARLLREPQGAQDALHRAFDRAVQAGRSELEPAIWRELAWVTSYELDAAAEARVWLEHARSARTEASDPTERAALLAVEAQVLQTEQRPAEAVQLRREVLALLQGIHPPDHPELVLARQDLAVSHGLASDPDEALALHTALWHELRARHGSDHPWTARGELDVGLDYVDLERYPEARLHLERARRVLAATHGEGNPRVASADLMLARLDVADEQLDLTDELLDRAIARAQHALAVYSERFPRGHSDRISALALLSELYRAAGQRDPLMATNRELLAIHDEGSARAEIDLQAVLINIGEGLCERERCGEALPFFGRLMALHVQDPPAEAALRAFPFHGIGQVHLVNGEPALALPFLEEALAIFASAPHERDGMAANYAACARHLAQALQKLGRSPGRVRELRRLAAELEPDSALP